VKIRSGELRGVLSEGMLCSLGELGLTLHDVPGAAEDGVLILNDYPEAIIGHDIRKALGFDDWVVDFEITPNRQDCFSVLGLARESAVTYGKKFVPDIPVVRGSGGNINEIVKIRVDDPELCPRYSARVMRNVKIRPSPKWMRDRLRACGVRPINNIVDVTNYVMLEYGQPMHSFDYDLLAGGEITVRRARDGEKMTTIDAVDRPLDPDMLVIADAGRAIAIAGVMGGANSEITENTRTVVFESANFNPTSTRLTSRKLGMRTDASGLFEKGLDPENTVAALQRACELIGLLDAGEVVDGIIDINATRFIPRT